MNFKPNWRQIDPMLMGLTVMVTLLGIFMIYDAGFARAIVAGDGPIPREFISQIGAGVLALVAGAWLTRLPVSWWRKNATPIMLVSAAAVYAVMVPGVGYVQSGAKRWLNVPLIHPQPSEFAKVATLIFLAGIFATRSQWKDAPARLRDWASRMDWTIQRKWKRVLPLVLIVAVALKVEQEPDLGTASVILMIMFGMFILGGVSKKSLVWLSLMGLVGFGALAKLQPYRMDRILNHGARWEKGNVDDVGYQTTYSESAMAAGWVVGVGPGAGAAKHVLPARMTDFIMATVGEEFGVIGALCVLAMMGAITWRLFVLGQEQLSKAIREPDATRKADHRFAYLFLTGMSVWIGVQTGVNFLMANGTAPPIGIPLPFFSAGGSSLIALWLAMAIAQRCAHTGQEEVVPETRRIGWRNRRTRLPGAGSR